MNDVVFAQVVERDKNLNCEPLDQVEGESLEVVHLDELVQVDREHLERYHEVLSEHELVKSSDDVLLVLGVSVVQVPDQLGLDQTLLVQPLLVLEDLERAVLLFLVVVALEHDTEGSSAEFFLNFISVLNLIFCFINIICLVVVESVVVRGARALLGVLVLARQLILDVLPNSLVLAVEGQVVNHVEFEYLFPLVGGQVLAVVL